MKDRSGEYSLVLLAGGKSRRMGRDKAKLTLGGNTFLECVLEKGKNLGIKDIFLSGHAYEGTGVQIIPDRYPNRGPMGGIHACMEVMTTPYCLVLPVDVPQIPLELLEGLLRNHENRQSYGNCPAALLLEHGQRIETLIGIFSRELVPVIEKEIYEHSCSILHVLEITGYETLYQNVQPWAVDNINTPEAYQFLKEQFGESSADDRGKPYLVAVSGVKNSGKTTFLEKLIRELTLRGYKTAVIKHDGHDFRADIEGTDTWRLAKAGAYGCGIFSPHKWMVIKEQEDTKEENLLRLFPEAEIILLEGFKYSPYLKFEVVRRGISEESVCRWETLLGIVTDIADMEEKIPGVPVLGLEDASRCADIISEKIRQKPHS